ncbi:MAG: twin-arginine translocase subunit TatC [Actinomycetota bacterium]|nr:twin-arginine translocase subunit TatC [Actinomycetota bacterium]
MAKALRPIGHDDRLSIVEHLDELRSRLIVTGLVLAVAFGVCFWQNHALINVLNRALPHVSTVAGHHGLAAVHGQSVSERQALMKTAKALDALTASPGQSSTAKSALATAAHALAQAAKTLPSNAPVQEKPITIGVGEPFVTTLTVSAYFALLITLPLLIYQGYAFVIPALNPHERGVATPLMTVAPALFLAGAAFAYWFILPPAVHFLQGYNSSQFDILVQAKAYYGFEIFTMLGVGLAFQLPLGLLGLQRLGVINGRTLTQNWRYATVIMAVIAAALPGADPVTTGLEMLPLVVLYLASIVLLRIADRRAAAREATELAQIGDSLEPS